MQSIEAIRDGGVRGAPVKLNAFNRGSRVAYAVLAWVLVACVGYQVYLAGLSIFVSPANWGRHVGFVHIFGETPVLILLLAFCGRMPKGMSLYLWPAVLYFLIGMQYGSVESGVPIIAALHPVNALLISWCSVHLALRATRFLRSGAMGGSGVEGGA